MRSLAGIALAVVLGWVALDSSAAVAQVLPTTNPQRDCKTLLACNYTRGGSYRGCISAYSCRVCRTVPAPCKITGGGRKCHEIRCGWG